MYSQAQFQTLMEMKHRGYTIMSSTLMDGGQYRLSVEHTAGGTRRDFLLYPSGDYVDITLLPKGAA